MSDKPEFIPMLKLICRCSAPLTICYEAELSAPVTIFSCLRARGKRCSGKVCTAEEKGKKQTTRATGRGNGDDDTDRAMKSSVRKRKDRVEWN